MSIYRNLSAVVAVVIACASGPCSTAQAEGVDAGLVVDYAPARASHVIVHRESPAETPIRLGTVVQVNDVVKLRGEGRVMIQLADGTEKEIDGPGEWRVPESSQPGTMARILRSLPGLLEKQATVAGSAASRGPEDCDSPQASVPIRVPILRPHARVTAGQQTLAIGWFGGCPPYAISLRSASSEIGICRRIDETAAPVRGAGPASRGVSDPRARPLRRERQLLVGGSSRGAGDSR